MAGQVQIRNAELVSLLSADFINCWIPIAQAVLTEPAAVITFDNIPGNFRAIVLSVQARSDAQSEEDYVTLQFDEDVGNNYDWIRVYFECSATSYSCNLAQTSMQIGQVDGASARVQNYPTFTTWVIGHALVDREKWVYTENSGRFGDVSASTDLRIALFRGRWRDTSAVGQIDLAMATGNFEAGSRLALYGIL